MAANNFLLPHTAASTAVSAAAVATASTSVTAASSRGDIPLRMPLANPEAILAIQPGVPP